MTELARAGRRLAADLHRAGVEPARARIAGRAYADALGAGDEPAWERFYRAAFEALVAIGHVSPAGRVAYARLVALFDDDLGSRLIGPVDRRRLQRRLVEAA